MLFKALLLQTWYTLSDDALEKALDNRLSFRRFTGLSSSEKSPDHSVFSRFRDQLIKNGVQDRLFDELNRQMDAKGLMLKHGTLIDATVIEAAPKKPPANEDGTGGRSPDWKKKGSKYHFGDKAHVHDGNMLESTLSGDEDWAFADKAYDSKKNHEILEGKEIGSGILIKATRKRTLTAVEKRYNWILSKLRSPVERIFGTLKRSYRYCRAKYLGLRKNKLQLTMTSIAYNLRRMEKLCV